MNVFIIGCGFTKSVFPDAPLNQELLGKLSSESVCLLREKYGTQDIEIALTKLDADIAALRTKPEQPSELIELERLRGTIESELAKYFGDFYCCNKLMDQKPWLAKFIDCAFSPGDVVISLNYDCVLEGALDCRGKWTPNGGYGRATGIPVGETFPPSTVKVLKIHGSVSFASVPPIDAPNDRSVELVFAENFFPISAEHKEYGWINGSTYIIAPSYSKKPVFEITLLMLEALAASAKAKHFVVIGSSLRPEDGFLIVLLTCFLDNIGGNPQHDGKLIVVDPDPTSIGERIKGYCGANRWEPEINNHFSPISKGLEDSVDDLVNLIGKLKESSPPPDI